METILSSSKREVIISDKHPTVLIGERINPTGRKEMAAELRAGKLDIIQKEAVNQVRAGAAVLDVNIGVGVDEVRMLPRVVNAVLDTVDVPLCLDNGNPKALEAALKIYRGKPLINSVTGDRHSIDTILPLAEEYGAAVIGLTMDNEGIPRDSNRRVSIACRIVERAEALGIPREDIVIDCLVQTVGADSGAGVVLLESICKVKAKLGVNLTVGASNVSFGLPDRWLVNSTFLAIAVASGVTCPIVDVAQVRGIVAAVDLILGRDNYAKKYLQAYRQRQAAGCSGG